MVTFKNVSYCFNVSNCTEVNKTDLEERGTNLSNHCFVPFVEMRSFISFQVPTILFCVRAAIFV